MNINETADTLAETMAKQLRVRGSSLSDVAAKAGRRLPKRLHAEVQVVQDAVALDAHPKLGHRLDERRVKIAAKRIEKFLLKQDPAAERRGEILDRIAAVAFVLFTVALALFFFLLWRGAFER
ncbi:MAG: hypothetical protein AAFY06_07705 [Pseudomonadota bacterium]